MKKILIFLSLLFPAAVFAMNWDGQLKHIGQQITNKTAQLGAVQEFLSNELQNPPAALAMALRIQLGVMRDIPNGPSESTLAGLYFVKTVAEKTRGLPRADELTYEDCNEAYEVMYPAVFPQAPDEPTKSSFTMKTLVEQLFSLKGGIGIAIVGYLFYRSTQKNKEQQKA